MLVILHDQLAFRQAVGVCRDCTTTFSGLVANGDGVTLTDDDCGVLLLDLTTTLVQSGSSVTGIGTVTIRVAPDCSDAIGFSDTQQITGSVTGSLASGSGTITAIIGTGDDRGGINGIFANGRMTGTLAFLDGSTGTFAMNRQ